MHITLTTNQAVLIFAIVLFVYLGNEARRRSYWPGAFGAYLLAGAMLVQNFKFVGDALHWLMQRTNITSPELAPLAGALALLLVAIIGLRRIFMAPSKH